MDIKRQILSDLKVDLTEEFDKNFTRKGFFSERWKPRAHNYRKGTLMSVTSKLRRSVKSSLAPSGVRFSSSLPYAAAHNEGSTAPQHVRAHTRRTPSGKQAEVRAHTRKTALPRRQFVGRSPETDAITENIIARAARRIQDELKQNLKQD